MDCPTSDEQILEQMNKMNGQWIKTHETRVSSSLDGVFTFSCTSLSKAARNALWKLSEGSTLGGHRLANVALTAGVLEFSLACVVLLRLLVLGEVFGLMLVASASASAFRFLPVVLGIASDVAASCDFGVTCAFRPGFAFAFAFPLGALGSFTSRVLFPVFGTPFCLVEAAGLLIFCPLGVLPLCFRGFFPSSPGSSSSSGGCFCWRAAATASWSFLVRVTWQGKNRRAWQEF